MVSFKWIFNIKHSADGSIENFKERFVAQGFSQKEGIYCEENFVLVARYTLIRTILALASKMRWKLHQMDVNTTFLNGFIQEEVYIEQPPGFETHDKKTYLCQLNKEIYVLKKASREWYKNK